MDEKILRETFDHNLNESFRLKQLENSTTAQGEWHDAGRTGNQVEYQ